MGYRKDAENEIAAITSIKADLMGVYARIEHELGAHPNYTEAQTMISETCTHLDQPLKEAATSAAYSHAPATTPEQARAQVDHDAAVATHQQRPADEADGYSSEVIGGDKPPYLKG